LARRARHVDDPHAVVGRRVRGVAEVELRALAQLLIVVDPLLHVGLGLALLADGGRAVVGPGDVALDRHLLIEELLALDAELLDRVLAVRRWRREVERRNARHVELLVVGLHLGLRTLELVLLATGDERTVANARTPEMTRLGMALLIT